jgi:hypothetical protein
VDTLRGSGDSVVFGVFERAGTYRLDASRAGYQPWSIDGVQVTQGVCHIQAVSVTARLVPQ